MLSVNVNPALLASEPLTPEAVARQKVLAQRKEHRDKLVQIHAEICGNVPFDQRFTEETSGNSEIPLEDRKDVHCVISTLIWIIDNMDNVTDITNRQLRQLTTLHIFQEKSNIACAPIHLEAMFKQLPNQNPAEREKIITDTLITTFIKSYDKVKSSPETLFLFCSKLSGDCIDQRTERAFNYALQLILDPALQPPRSLEDILYYRGNKLADGSFFITLNLVLNQAWGELVMTHNKEVVLLNSDYYPSLKKTMEDTFDLMKKADFIEAYFQSEKPDIFLRLIVEKEETALCEIINASDFLSAEQQPKFIRFLKESTFLDLVVQNWQVSSLYSTFLANSKIRALLSEDDYKKLFSSPSLVSLLLILTSTTQHLPAEAINALFSCATPEDISAALTAPKLDISCRSQISVPSRSDELLLPNPTPPSLTAASLSLEPEPSPELDSSISSRSNSETAESKILSALTIPTILYMVSLNDEIRQCVITNPVLQNKLLIELKTEQDDFNYIFLSGVLDNDKNPEEKIQIIIRIKRLIQKFQDQGKDIEKQDLLELLSGNLTGCYELTRQVFVQHFLIEPSHLDFISDESTLLKLLDSLTTCSAEVSTLDRQKKESLITGRLEELVLDKINIRNGLPDPEDIALIKEKINSDPRLGKIYAKILYEKCAKKISSCQIKMGCTGFNLSLLATGIGLIASATKSTSSEGMLISGVASILSSVFCLWFISENCNKTTTPHITTTCQNTETLDAFFREHGIPLPQDDATSAATSPLTSVGMFAHRETAANDGKVVLTIAANDPEEVRPALLAGSQV
jgi:hypothetical protein